MTEPCSTATALWGTTVLLITLGGFAYGGYRAGQASRDSEARPPHGTGLRTTMTSTGDATPDEEGGRRG